MDAMVDFLPTLTTTFKKLEDSRLRRIIPTLLEKDNQATAISTSPRLFAPSLATLPSAERLVFMLKLHPLLEDLFRFVSTLPLGKITLAVLSLAAPTPSTIAFN